MEGNHSCVLLLVSGVYIMQFSLRCSEATWMYESCREAAEMSTPDSISQFQQIVQGTKIMVLETADLVSRLQNMHVDNTCLSSKDKEDNSLARIRSCRVYHSLMTFNISILYDILNITEWSNEEYLLEITWLTSTVSTLANVLHDFEHQFPYKQLYRTILNNTFDILCALSDFWTGDERALLEYASVFHTNTVRFVENSLDPTESFLILRILDARLQLIDEKLLTFDVA